MYEHPDSLEPVHLEGQMSKIVAIATITAAVTGVAALGVSLLAYFRVDPTSQRLRTVVAAGAATVVIGSVAFLGGRLSVDGHSQSSATPTTTALATGTNGATEKGKAKPFVHIESPHEGEDVGRPIVVGGMAKVGIDDDVWILVLASGEGRFYLPSRDPVNIDAAGKWSLPNVKLGRTNGLDKGHRYDVFAIALPRDASSELQHAINEGRGWTSRLPTETQAKHSVRVTLQA
jgi:hypothetical protein